MLKKVIIIAFSLIFIIVVAIAISMNYVGGKVIDKAIDSEMVELQRDIDRISSQSGIKDDSSTVSTKTVGVGDTVEEKKKQAAEKLNIEQKKKTIEKLKNAKSKITAQDRMAATTLVASRLSPADIAKLEGLLAGGLNPKERQQAVALAYVRFTPAEIAQIKELYYKYVNQKN